MIVPWQERLLETFSLAWMPADKREIYEWAADNIVLSPKYSMSGKFSVDRSRYMIDVFKALKNPDIRQVNVMGPPRTAKSTIAGITLMHSIAFDSGNFLWVSMADGEMAKFSEVYLTPLVQGCKPVSALLDYSNKNNITKERMRFAGSLVVLSGAKISALQAIGYKRIYFDECHLAKDGFIAEAKARFKEWLSIYKLFCLSQGGKKVSEWNREFNSGYVYEWGYLCSACDKEQTLHWNEKREDGTWSGLYFPQNEITKPDGVWNITEAAKAAVLQCHFCKHELTDTTENRRYLNDSGRYIRVNPNDKDAKATIASFRWNDLCNPEIPFATLAADYLTAKKIEKDTGNSLPLEQFTNKSLAMPFTPGQQTSIRDIILAEYDPNDASGFDYTFMTVDCQKDFAELYYIIRRWKKIGDSRLVTYGHASSIAEIAEIQKANGLLDQFVWLDQGYEGKQVYSLCCDHSHKAFVKGVKRWLSWGALRGDQKAEYRHKKDNSLRQYSEQRRGPSGFPPERKDKPKSCPAYDFSSDGCSGMLCYLRDGKGVPWLANNVCDEYTRQLNSHYPETVVSGGKTKLTYAKKDGVADHYFDCEKMQVALALMMNCLGDFDKRPDEESAEQLDTQAS